MDDYLWVLKDDELALVRELEPKRLKALDEDELLDLHRRVRRARTKHVKNYRRKAALDVKAAGGRGKAAPKGGKARWRAAAFEEALAIVSGRLAHVAHLQAEALKEERLAQAKAGKSSGPKTSANPTADKVGPGRARSHQKTTGGKKRDASTKAQGARRQGKKDSR